MRRGDLYTAAARGAYSGKSRPVVIIQDDRFDATTSVTVCPLTTSRLEAPLIRIPLEPSDSIGIQQPSQIMIDKVTTMPRSGVRDYLGRLSATDLVRLNRALMVFLGLVN